MENRKICFEKNRVGLKKCEKGKEGPLEGWVCCGIPEKVIGLVDGYK